MNLEVVLSPLAKTDIADAVKWFETQHPGLGAEFAQAIDHKLTLVTEFPKSCQPFRGSLRRAIIRRFGYAVVYRIDGDLIQVVAIMACRRQTAMQQRLARRDTRSN
jgi:plasmid stabilization system protein ParE